MLFSLLIFHPRPSIVSSSIPVSVQAQSAPNAPHDYKAVWTKVSHAIENGLFNHRQMASDIKKWEAEAGPGILASKTDAEFRDRVEGFIKKFGDSHFDFYIKSDQGYYVMDALARNDKADQMPNCGAYFAPTGNGDWKVAFVLDDTSAFKVGLRPGDVMRTANGKPFAPVDSFTGQDGKKIQLGIVRDGNPLTLTVEGSSDQSLDQMLQATRASEKIIKQDGKKIGYIHLWTQTTASFVNFLQSAVLGNLYDTDAFILDNRSGYGGRPEGYSTPFFLPQVDFAWTIGGNKSIQHFGYSKPLVELIDHYSRSAKEMLSQVLKTSKRAVLVGQTTAGNVLGTFPNRVADWCYLEMPIADVAVDGKRLEKVGVSPNIGAPLGFNGKGEDLTLQAGIQEAVKLAKEKAGAESSNSGH